VKQWIVICQDCGTEHTHQYNIPLSGSCNVCKNTSDDEKIRQDIDDMLERSEGGHHGTRGDWLPNYNHGTIVSEDTQRVIFTANLGHIVDKLNRDEDILLASLAPHLLEEVRRLRTIENNLRILDKMKEE